MMYSTSSTARDRPRARTRVRTRARTYIYVGKVWACCVNYIYMRTHR